MSNPSPLSPLPPLPAGRVMTEENLVDITEATIAKGSRLTQAEIIALVGQPLATPTVKRDWETGEYPVPRIGGVR